ncbi:MAG TPA: phosphotransferase [Pseudomonas sp.]|nr:phosphotransferase [Pseudomonas sp.]
MIDHDVRLQRLSAWFDRLLPELFESLNWGSVTPGELTPASSDASFRRYFRWQAGERSLVLMDAPPPREDCRPFVKIAGLLADAGVHVPRVLASDLEQGFLVLDDLGRQTYLEVIDTDNADRLFDDAVSALLAFQRLPRDADLPDYDEALLRRELQLFPEWYLAHELQLAWNAEQQAAWERVCRLLIDSALAQPRVLVHRDYMPRNLMLSEPNPGVLDFQDAVWGPASYDIICLFKDAFLSWPLARVDAWLERYWQRACEAGIAVPQRFEDFLRDCDLMGVQRHLKVIGIFARICHRDGKPRYLTDVPRFFAYIDEVAARRPELAELRDLLAQLPERGA